MRINILIGGEAGQGPNILANIIGEVLARKGYYVFCSRNYESRVRGGHNFNTLTFSEKPVYSNDLKIDILISLDKKTKEIHKDKIKKNTIVLSEHKNNLYFAGRLIKILKLNFEELKKEIMKINKNTEENLKNAREGFDEEEKFLGIGEPDRKEKDYINGSQGIADGAVKSGIDLYYAYPMTPATGVLNELSSRQKKENILALEMESELSAINSAVGSSITGAKVMIGTSGGGFDLMSEAISLTGMAEIPIVIYLASRPGPSTGLPTLTAQPDLNAARNSGHGEFPRFVVAPGEPKEAQELTSHAFYFSQKFKIPSIILSDKHLAESFCTIYEKPEIISSKKSIFLKKYSGNETDELGFTTFNPEIARKNAGKRLKKIKEIEKESGRFERYKIYGDKKSRNVIVGWGSTKGAILDSIKDLKCKFVQILYIEPFPKEIAKELEGNLILVENNLTGQLGNLITEKTGIIFKEENKILRYDGMPFLADELEEEIERRLK
ncbi:MAG: 2-oxoacid:acceptor oxidoreductase family protein [archaeon]